MVFAQTNVLCGLAKSKLPNQPNLSVETGIFVACLSHLTTLHTTDLLQQKLLRFGPGTQYFMPNYPSWQELRWPAGTGRRLDG